MLLPESHRAHDKRRKDARLTPGLSGPQTENRDLPKALLKCIGACA